MTLPAEWCYCHKLPTVRTRRAGTLAKCPRCRGDLIVAWYTGAKNRLDVGECSAGPNRTLAAVAVAAIALVAAAIVLGVVVRRQPELEQPGDVVHEALSVPVQRAPAPRIKSEPIPAPQSELAVAEQLPVQQSHSKTGPQPVVSIAWAKPVPAQTTEATANQVVAQAPTKASEALYPPNASDQEEKLRAQLLDHVPEISLHQGSGDHADVNEAKMRMQRQAAAIAKKLKNDPDSFVHDLMEMRTDLAGLPWRLGKESELDSTSAENMQKRGLCFRDILDTVVFREQGLKSGAPETRNPEEIPAVCYGLRSALTSDAIKELSQNDMAPRVLAQILIAEKRELRHILVEFLGALNDAGTTDTLARLAVFDLNPTVRVRAIEALEKRSPNDYVPALLEGLRHPWPAAAQHAAQALVSLKGTEALEALVKMLGEPDPGRPFLQTVQGRQVPVLRELVRVNHLRNCLLCHAPSVSDNDTIRAIVPTPGEKLPSRAAMYHADDKERPGVTLVRAEVTYLKQDFSVMQKVAKPGAWPSYQRFDYLVRLRPLNFAERIAFEVGQEADAARQPSAHHGAILFALRSLTGRDAGTSAEAWQQLLRMIRE